MDISREILHGLSLLSEPRERLTDDEVGKILETVSRSLVWRVGEEKEQGEDMDRGEEKLACLSLISLLITIARLNTGIENEVLRIRDILSDCEVSRERTELVTNLYTSCRERMQDRLADLSTTDDASLPAFRDLKWTQEVTLKSSQLDRLESPVIHYLISLRHESGSLDFAAGVDDLHEMVHSLRECCKAIDGIVKQRGQLQD